MSEHTPYSREEIPEGWTRPRPPGYYLRQAERQRKSRAANPEKHKQRGRQSEYNRRLKRYGVTREWFEEQLAYQCHLCSVCNNPLDFGKSTHVDHNHATGKVRAILCSSCNFLIGNAKENIKILKSAISYLEKYKND